MLAIIQARTNSQRLPGKVLTQICGVPLINRVYQSVKKCTHVTDIVVATSVNPSDDLLAEHCRNAKIECHRGELESVYDRFLGVLEKKSNSAFVRICADSPLIDASTIDEMVCKFNLILPDIVTNVRHRSFPKGQSVEIISTKIFKEARKYISESRHLEHVTSFFYENSKQYEIDNIEYCEDRSCAQLSIDTLDDLHRMTKLINNIGDEELSLKELMARYDEICS